MYLPPRNLDQAHPWADFFESGHKDVSEKWSSFIGIVTAIVGNVLISFALNTQRYAHMRLSRERDERDERSRTERKIRRKKVPRGYGTQDEIAEHRAEAHRKAEQHGPVPAEEEVDETEPLIPSVDSLDTRKMSGSSSAEDEDSEEGSESEDDETKSKSYLSSPIWWVGIAMMTIGEAGNFLAYGFAPASIVSPMGVVALVSNCLIAPLLLHERFRWRDGVGVVVAVAGCVTVVLSASDSNPKLDPDSIWHLITRWEFETYLGITIFLIIALCVASNKFGERTILIDLGLVGLFGGYTALSTKGVASLLSNTIWRVVTFPITYLLVAVLVGTAVMQIKYVNRALQRFDATMVIPTQFVMFTLSVIIGSAILYRDFERTTTQQAIKFVGGCALTFLGVYFITSGRNNDSRDDNDSEGEGEEGISLIDEERRHHEVRERDDALGRRKSLLAASSKSLPANGKAAAQERPIVTPTSPIKPPDLTPAQSSAIHEHSASHFPQPPSSRDAAPPIHATTSAPEVPTTQTLPSTPAARPKTPARGASATAIDSPSKAPPSTPQPRRPPPDQQQYLDPSTSHKLLNRHSIAGLVPGPLTSPLSSSLSAIVADSLRRGVDHLPGSAGATRRRSILRRGVSKRDPDAPPLKRHSIASGEMDFPDVGGSSSNGAAEQGRIRSLSASLGEAFSPTATGGVNKRAPKDPGAGDRLQ